MEIPQEIIDKIQIECHNYAELNSQHSLSLSKVRTDFHEGAIFGYSLRDDEVAVLKEVINKAVDRSVYYQIEIDELNNRLNLLEEEARQGRISESQLIIAEQRIEELEEKIYLMELDITQRKGAQKNPF